MDMVAIAEGCGGPLGFEECRGIYRSMRERHDNNVEEERVAIMSLSAPYIVCGARRAGVDRLWQLCEHLGMRETTAHVATWYLDRLLQREVDDDAVARLGAEALGVACVRLAAKFEAREEDVPPLERLVGRRVSKKDHAEARDAEVAVATALDWRLYCVSSLHYVEHLNACTSGQGIVGDGDVLEGAAASAKDAQPFCCSYTTFFANMALQDASFLAYPAPALAAAIVLATRSLLSIRPVWPKRLADLTAGFHEAALRPIATHLLVHYHAEFTDHAKTVADFANSAVNSNQCTANARSPTNVANFRDVQPYAPEPYATLAW